MIVVHGRAIELNLGKENNMIPVNRQVLIFPIALLISRKLSTGKARMNLSEMNSWNFDEVRAACVSRWNEILNKIEVKGSDEQKKIFYTALYHSYLQPVDKTGENSKWISDEPYYDDYYCIWDTFRATHPLFTLLTPSKQVDMLRSLLDIYRYEGYAPDARSGDDNGRVQGGSNVDILFADAIVTMPLLHWLVD